MARVLDDLAAVSDALAALRPGVRPEWESHVLTLAAGLGAEDLSRLSPGHLSVLTLILGRARPDLDPYPSPPSPVDATGYAH